MIQPSSSKMLMTPKFKTITGAGGKEERAMIEKGIERRETLGGRSSRKLLIYLS